jgi:hypothetical protein
MTQVQDRDLARRFCAIMAAVCWLVFAAAVIFSISQAWNLWGSLHGQHSGTSFGVTMTTEGPNGAGRTMKSVMVSGSVITAVSLFSTLCGVAAIWSAGVFFSRLARGEVFARGTFNALRAFAVATLLMQLQPVVMAMVSATSVAGFHLGFFGTALAVLADLVQPSSAPNIVLLGLLVAMVAVLGRANQVAEDHAAIV